MSARELGFSSQIRRECNVSMYGYAKNPANVPEDRFELYLLYLGMGVQDETTMLTGHSTSSEMRGGKEWRREEER